ncbi:MAG TPA: complex I subunit 1 family protein [Polyangiaceae bacterium]|nr:complex I subunit 1 family protein [Polyangiaceae bacterium]
MSWQDGLIFGLKAFAVVMFAMNVAVILTWADRRQGAMIQDRVGPNRAVAWLPTKVVQALLLLPALGVAALVIFLAATSDVSGPARGERAMLWAHLAILMTWLTGVIIAGRVRARGVKSSFDRFMAALGDPRNIFYGGIAAHLLIAVVGGMTQGSEAGETLREVGYRSGPAVLAFVIAGGAAYAVYSIRNEPRIGLRLAGLLHPAADGLKTMFKEDFVPPNADRFLHGLAPFISFFPALVVLAVVPFGDTLCFGTTDGSIDFGALAAVVPQSGVCTEGAVSLQVVDLNIGILYFFALAGTGIVGAALAGWASDNKFSLLGGLRAASQMVSYEVTLGLTIIGAVMIYGTLRIDEMVRWQGEHAWGIFVQPLAFFLFFAASVAEAKRIPFDIPEGESEIVAGYFTEYSGMKFAMFFFSEYIAVVTSSALMVALFLGGWQLPFLDRNGLHVVIGETAYFSQTLSHLAVVLIGVLAFVLKTIALCSLQLAIRWTLPRFRYDQLMRLGWRKLLPASLVNILLTGLIVLAVQAAGPSIGASLAIIGDLTEAVLAVAGIAGAVAFVLFLLKPAQKRRYLVSTSQQYAAAAGGTRTARMGA